VPLRQAQTVTPEAAGNISGKLRRRNALIEKDLGHAQMSGDVVGGQASISHLYKWIPGKEPGRVASVLNRLDCGSSPD
jgi:hypothetical protein